MNNNAFSQEQFNFDVTEVQILEKGNLFIGKKRGKIETNDRVIIDANKFEYNKKLNLLKTDGNIKINDKELNLIITTDKAIYYKNKEQIFTNGNSKAIYENNLIVTANEFEFDKFKNILKAIGNVKVKNLKENYEIFSEKLTYFKNSQKIIPYGETKSLIKNQYTINSDDVTYLIDNNILSSKKKTDINDNKSNFYFLDQFSFDANKEQLKGKGVLIITNFGLPKSDKIYFSD